MKMLIMRFGKSSLLCAFFALAAAGCSRAPDSKQDTTPPAQSAQVPNADAPVMVRGTVVRVSPTELVLKSDSGQVTVKTAQPFHVYTRVPSSLSQVKQSSFIGVTTVKQTDGSERATEIHVFPEELRGVGEGSRMMAPDTTMNPSRMTNGSVSASRMTNGMATPSRMSNGTAMPSRMTNGSATPSRMSNGSVSSTNGSTLVVQYAGGSQTVTVPPKTPVTEFKLATKALAAGDQVAVLAKRATDGSLTADKALSMAK